METNYLSTDFESLNFELPAQRFDDNQITIVHKHMIGNREFLRQLRICILFDAHK